MTTALLIDLAWRFKAWIMLAIMTALCLFAVSSCSNKERDIKQITADYELVITNERLKTTEQIANMERKHYEQNIKAANEYQEREQVIIADAASARDAVASLSDTLSQVTAQAATDANFQRDALAITSDSLETCSARYSELATTTDRLANSLRATVEANRR